MKAKNNMYVSENRCVGSGRSRIVCYLFGLGPWGIPPLAVRLEGKSWQRTTPSILLLPLTSDFASLNKFQG